MNNNITYKYSIYNSILELNSEYGLCYNSMSDRFIVLRRQAYEDICSCDVLQLRAKNIALYHQLLNINAIVDASLNEVESLRNLIRSIDNDDTCFQLHINPTVDCNFHCWYCYEEHVKGSRMMPEMVDKVKSLIDNILSNKKSITVFLLSFFGGEPLLYFASVVRPLMEYLMEVCAKKMYKQSSGSLRMVI